MAEPTREELLARIAVLEGENKRLKDNWNIVSKRIKKGMTEVQEMVWAMGTLVRLEED